MIFVMGTNKWRAEQEWPLARAQNTSFYLTSVRGANSWEGDGELCLERPTSNSTQQYLYDPENPVPTAGGPIIGIDKAILRQNEIEKRPDVLVYTSDKLIGDTEVTGPIKVVLYVSTSAPCTDFTAKLVDVHPSGEAFNISDGICRKSFSGGAARVHEVEIELWPTSMVFLRGHRIRLEISSSNFPRFDANPNTGRNVAYETKPVLAYQKLYCGSQHPSRLILPMVPANR